MSGMMLIALILVIIFARPIQHGAGQWVYWIQQNAKQIGLGIVLGLFLWWVGFAFLGFY